MHAISIVSIIVIFVHTPFNKIIKKEGIKSNEKEIILFWVGFFYDCKFNL